MEGILLVPMDRSVIFLAKATSNLLFLLVVEVIAVPLFWFFFLTTAQPGPGFMLMAVPLAVGTIGTVSYTHLSPARPTGAGTARSRCACAPSAAPSSLTRPCSR